MKKRIFKMAAAALTALTMLCQLVPALADDSAATTLTGPGYTVIPGDLKVEIGGGSQGNGNWSIYKPNSVTNGMTIGNDRTKKFVSYFGYTWERANGGANSGQGLKYSKFNDTYNMKSSGVYKGFVVGKNTLNVFSPFNKYIDEGDDFIAAINYYKINYAAANAAVRWGGVDTENKGVNFSIDESCLSHGAMDISSYVDNGYMVVGINFGAPVELEHAYVAVASQNVSVKNGSDAKSTDSDKSVVGVPLSRYLTNSTDANKYREIIIPLSDFDVSNDWVYAPYVDDNSASAKDDFDSKVPVNWKKVVGMGLIKTKSTTEGVFNSIEWTNFIFNSKMQIRQASAPVASVANGKLTWTPTDAATLVGGYEIAETKADGTTDVVTVDDKDAVEYSGNLNPTSSYKVRAVISGNTNNLAASEGNMKGKAYSAYSNEVTAATAATVNDDYNGNYVRIDFKAANTNTYKFEATLNNKVVFERTLTLEKDSDGKCTIKSAILPADNMTYNIYCVNNGVSSLYASVAAPNAAADGKWAWGVYEKNGSGNVTSLGNGKSLCINAKLNAVKALQLVGGTDEYAAAVTMGKMKAVIATYNISDGKCEMTSCKVFDPAVEPVMIQSTNLKANTKIGVMLLEDFDTVKPIYQTNGGYVGAAGEVLHDYNS